MRGNRRFVGSRRRWLAPIPLIAVLAVVFGGFSAGNAASVDPACTRDDTRSVPIRPPPGPLIPGCAAFGARGV